MTFSGNNGYEDTVPFLGMQKRKFDEKNRLVLPSKFLSKELEPESHLYILMQKDKKSLPYLYATSLSNLEKELSIRKISFEDISPILEHTKIDSAKRVILNNILMDYIGAYGQESNDLWLFGKKTHFSIYSLENGQKCIYDLQRCML